MKQYDSYQIDNDMWYKKRKHIYYLMGMYDDGQHCACIIATYSLKTKRLLIKDANEHMPESRILRQFIEYAESEGLQEKQVLGDYNDEHDGHCACTITTYSLKTKRLLIEGANKHIPESKILRQFIEHAESEGLQEREI